jgi:hypothetical protein
MTTLPFNDPNGRIFYACQAVLVNSQDGYGTDPSVFKRRGRNTEESVDDEDIKESIFLEGVQAVGVNGDFPSQSLLDVGKVGRQYHYYSQQNFELTIERKIDENQDFFYSLNPSNYTDYQNSHILHKDNLGDKGFKDQDNKVLRQFDITILYTPDKFRYMGSDLDKSLIPPNPTPDADADKVMSITYQSCLLSGIDYNISVDGVTESITLRTKQLKYNKGLSTLSDYKFSNRLTNSTGSAQRYTTMPHSGVAVNSANQYAIKTLKRENLDILKQDEDRKSILPAEVESMFEAGNTDSIYRGDDGQTRPLKILGISSININVAIDYNELSDTGFWRGSEIDKEYEQNKYTQVNLPIQVTSSFTGYARRALEYDDLMWTSSEDNVFVRNSDLNFAASGVMNTDTGLSGGGGPFREGIDTVNEPPKGQNKTVYNKSDRIIRLVFQTIDVPAMAFKYHIMDLGAKNYLTSIATTGGEAGGGGNVETTISYQNDFSDIVLVKDTQVRNLINEELF